MRSADLDPQLAPPGLLGRHRGWTVVAGCFVVLFAAFGASYSFGPLFEAFASTFGASRAEVSGVFALAGLLYFLVGLPAGLAADRFGTRAVAVPGAVLLAAGLWGASRAQSLTELLWLYALALGFGVGLVYAPAVGAVQPWFARRRGLASGLAVAGIGTGTLVVPPVVAWIAQTQDWRAALAWMGLVLGAASLAGACLLDNRPQRHGIGPDGTRVPRMAPGAARGTVDGAGMLEAVRGRASDGCT
jgi:MFS family permease